MTKDQSAEQPTRDPGSGIRDRRARIAVAVAVAALLALVAFARGIHPFLAPVQPVDSPNLVIEGWMPDYALESALQMHRARGGTRVFTTGGPLPRGSHLAEFTNYAAVAGATLLKLGLPREELVVAAAPNLERNRTYGSAVALREYCRSNHISLNSLNLVSLGTHARRSRLCFQAALGDDVRIGVIAIPSQDYDPNAWWHSSEGVKCVFGELLGVGYAWLAIDYGL